MSDELNDKGYPKILDKVLEITGITYEDIEREKLEERKEFSNWVDVVNLKKRFERGEMTIEEYEEHGFRMLNKWLKRLPMLDTEEDDYSLKLHGGRHD